MSYADLLDTVRLMLAKPSLWNPRSPRAADGSQALTAWWDAAATGGVQSDGAVSFTAACKHYLSCPDNATVSATTVLDLCLWVYLDSVGANRVFVAKGTQIGTAANLEYCLYYAHTGTNFKFSVSDGSTITTVTDTGAAPSTATWYFIHCGLKADGTLFISRNNAAEITSASCPAIQDGANAFVLGALTGDATYCDGRIDSLALSKTTPSAAEVTALYNAGAGRTYADLTAANGLDTFATNCVDWWDFDEETQTRYGSKAATALVETFDDIIGPAVLNGGFETLAGGEALGSELLTNGGFETAGGGGADIWGSWSETAGSGAIADETTIVHGGSHAAKLTRVTGGAYISAGATVTASTRYKATFWMRGDGTRSGRYKIFDAIGSADIVAMTDPSITGTDWTLVTVYFTTPTGCTSARIYFYSPSSAGDAYFDDVSVKQVTSGDIFGSWSESVLGSSSLEANTASPDAGTYDLKLNVDAAGSACAVSQAVLTVGKRYAVSWRAKASSGTPSMYCGGSAGGVTSVSKTLTTSYATYWGDFTPTGTSFYVSRSTATSVSIYIDNVTLRSAEIVRAAGLAKSDATTETTLGPELLTNGGFETLGAGGADVFGTWSETAGSGTIADETTAIKAGLHAAKLSYATGESEIYNAITTTALTSYRLTFWTRGDGTRGGQYKIYDATGSADIVAKTATAITGTTYTQVNVSFTTPASCVSVRIYLYSPSASGDAYYDEVSVKQVYAGRAATVLDQSGNGNHLTQTTEGYKPTLKLARQNALAGLDFDGANDALSNANDLFGATDLTVFFVVSEDSAGQGGFGVILHNGKWTVANTSSNRLYATSDGSTTTITGTNAVVFGTAAVWIITRTSAGAVTFYKNGTVTGTAGADTGTPAVASSASVVGNRFNLDRTIDAQLFDTGIYKGTILSAAQITQLTNHMKSKWGIV